MQMGGFFLGFTYLRMKESKMVTLITANQDHAW